MCAINPSHTASFELKVYTSEKISKLEFENLVLDKLGTLLDTEMKLNEDCKLRWHLQPMKYGK